MKSMNRRVFLKSGAVAAAAFTIGKSALGANGRIRVGVIGLRNRGNQVADSMNACGRFEVAALCDCDRAMYDVAVGKIGRKLEKVPAFTQDFRKVLDDPGIDAVVVALPDHWHGLATVMALDAGKHVYVEKPMSHNILDGRAMVAAAARNPKLAVQVGTQQRSGPHFQEARDFIRGGGLGKVGFARAWITHDRDTVPRVPDADPPAGFDYDLWVGPAPFRAYNPELTHYNWHFTWNFGTGEMGNWGAHWIDIVRWYLDLDLPSAVLGIGGQLVVKDAKETPDTQTAIYQFPETTVIWEQRLWTTFGINGKGSGAEFNGDKGSLVIGRDGWTFFPKEGPPEKHGRSEMELPHAVNFADAIQGTAKPIAPVTEGHKTAVMCHLANIAARRNGKLDFDPATEQITNDPEAQALAGRENRAPWPQYVL
ncbi:MAG TPA: Gfo/Idh/MocA family oxidoreductase [Candidatus Hydrogenedentes bacterium]|nr:Gfo/Idh/MocA family oxidoreductase [Candidatus Hydrogenedentota bacterium]HQL95848.1 Gfo/Idh/MocA family oxidoreductase [Candidatus Hydrogenedentota bacterium]